jgi:hypothetical protein
MEYTTKVILNAVIELMKRSKNLEEAIQLVTEIANAEDAMLDSIDPCAEEEPVDASPFSPAESSYCKIDGRADIRQGGARTFTARIYNTQHTDISDDAKFEFQWRHDIDASVLDNPAISGTTENPIRIQVGNKAKIGTTFSLTVNVTDADETIYKSDTISVEIVPLF